MSILKHFKLSVCAICVMTAVIIISCEAETGNLSYICENGTPTSGNGIIIGQSSCDACDQGYVLFGRPGEEGSTCGKFPFVCENGMAASGGTLTEGQNNCDRCNDGYTISGTASAPGSTCVNYPYVCTNGQAASGRTIVENTERCASCNSGRIVNLQLACGQGFVRVDSVTDDDALIAAAMSAGTTPLPTETLFLNGGVALTSAVIGSTTYLFAGAEAEGSEGTGGNRGSNGGINVFSVNGNTGELTRVAGVNGRTGLTAGISALAVATIGANTYLYASSQVGDSVQMFSVAANGTTLTAGTTTNDNNTINLDGARDLAVAAIGQTTYLFVAGFFDDGISVFSIGSTGALTNTDNVSDADNLYLDEVDVLTTAVIGTTTYLFSGASGNTASKTGDNGITVFSVSDAGALTRTDSVADDARTTVTEPYLDRVRSLTTLEIGGTTYLYAGSYGESALQIYTVSNLGKLTAVPGLVDEPDNTFDPSILTRQLENVNAVQAISIDGTGYVFAGGRDDGMSMFAVGSTGRLTEVLHIVEASAAATAALRNAELMADGLHLREINDMHTAFVGGSPYLFVINGYTGSASGMLSADSGINVFAIGKK